MINPRESVLQNKINESSAFSARSYDLIFEPALNVSVLPRLGGKGRGEGKMRTMTRERKEGTRTKVGHKLGLDWR